MRCSRTWSAGLVVCVLGLAVHPAAGAGPYVLTQDGRPTSAIVLEATPTKAAQLGAFELQHHIRLITGAAVPIVKGDEAVPAGHVRIFVGHSAPATRLGLTRDRFKMQEYAVRFLPGAIVLVGRDKDDRGHVKYDMDKDFTAFQTWPDFYDDQGTMYAVYDFLRTCCNVRWFNPTEVGTDYRRTRTLSVTGSDMRRSPVFRNRNAWVGGNSEGYDMVSCLWLPGSEAFTQYEQAAYAELHKRFPNGWHYTHTKRATIRLFQYRMKAGGEKCFCNHSLYGYYQRFWEKSTHPGAAKLFVERRPEMFAKGYQGRPPQMCYTSPALVRQVVQDARDYFDKGGFGSPAPSGLHTGFCWGENYFAIEPMDNSSYCKCDRCRARHTKKTDDEADRFAVYGRNSNYMFQFVNAVAKKLRKTHPDKYITALAYGSHLKHPDKVRLEPNVAVFFCFDHNRLCYARAGYEFQLNCLRDWVAKEKGRPIYLWLYYTFPGEIAANGKWFCFPGFFAHTIDKQMKLFAKLGLRGMFHCGYGQEVEAYVTYRLMDDPTLDIDALLGDYFTRYFGPAGEPLKKLYLAIEQTYSDPKSYPPGYSGHQSKLVAWDNLGTAERMDAFAKLVDQARRAVADADALYKRRLDLFEKSVWSYMVAGRAQHMAHKTAPIPSLGVPRVAAAGGDLAKVAWNRAGTLPGPWYNRTDKPASRRFSGRIAHDGRFLYLELTDPCDTKKLNASPTVFCYDDWEVFLAKQRAQPYRQYAVGPTALTVALSHGEVNWRMNVPVQGHGLKAVSDTSAPDKWVARLAFPLATVLPGGVKPGGKLYMNVTRVTGPAITGGRLGIDTWVSFCSVHDVDRLAELTLAP